MRTAALVFLLVAAGCSRPFPVPTVIRLENDLGTASGVALTDRWLLTAKHCLPQTHASGSPVELMIPHPDPDQDIALVKVRDPRPWTVAHRATQRPRWTDPLHAAGWHLGDYLLMTGGYQGVLPHMMSCEVIYGASGGPVLNAAGELVGIVEGLETGPTPQGDRETIPHIGYYTDVVGLAYWIDSNINK